MKLLEKEPCNRYASALDVKTDLERTTQPPPRSRKSPPDNKTAGANKRRDIPVFAVACTALALTVLLICGYFLSVALTPPVRHPVKHLEEGSPLEVIREMNAQDEIEMFVKSCGEQLDLRRVQGFEASGTLQPSDFAILKTPLSSKIHHVNINKLATINDAVFAEYFGHLDLDGLTASETSLADLHGLSRMKNLQTLDLEQTPLNADGVKVITGLSHLQTLNLTRTAVHGSWLTDLNSLTELSDLQLVGCQNLTPKDALSLMAALPLCSIAVSTPAQAVPYEARSLLKEAREIFPVDKRRAISLQFLGVSKMSSANTTFDVLMIENQHLAHQLATNDTPREAVRIYEKLLQLAKSHAGDPRLTARFLHEAATQLEKSEDWNGSFHLRHQLNELMHRVLPGCNSEPERYQWSRLAAENLVQLSSISQLIPGQQDGTRSFLNEAVAIQKSILPGSLELGSSYVRIAEHEFNRKHKEEAVKYAQLADLIYQRAAKEKRRFLKPIAYSDILLTRATLAKILGDRKRQLELTKMAYDYRRSLAGDNPVPVNQTSEEFEQIKGTLASGQLLLNLYKEVDPSDQQGLRENLFDSLIAWIETETLYLERAKLILQKGYFLLHDKGEKLHALDTFQQAKQAYSSLPTAAIDSRSRLEALRAIDWAVGVTHYHLHHYREAVPIIEPLIPYSRGELRKLQLRVLADSFSALNEPDKALKYSRLAARIR